MGTSSSTYTSSSTTNVVWNNWVADQYQTMTSQVWSSWMLADSTGPIAVPIHQPAPQLTPNHYAEINAAMVAERQEAARYYGQVRQKRSEADAKAMGLLREHLTPVQREALEKHGWFLVEGGKSKKTYRIHGHSFAGNIYELAHKGDLRGTARYCVHADHGIPLGDQLLAQLLSLRHDEEHIIGRANRTAIAA